jgi:hypothetical protein
MLDHDKHQQTNYNLATTLIGANGILQPLGKAKYMSRLFARHWLPPPKDTTTKNSKRQKEMLSNMQCYDNDAEYTMADEQALLCPARSRGFALRTKQWAFFLVDEVQDIVWHDDAFDKLELDQTMKDTIQALIMTSGASGLQFDDFVADKGKGLVMLLHGPPGAGKTLTAGMLPQLFGTRQSIRY